MPKTETHHKRRQQRLDGTGWEIVCSCRVKDCKK